MCLRLYSPQYHELSFREQLLSDPATMAFYRGNPPSEGYDPATGCIAFPRGDWAFWWQVWADRAPDFFYAYLLRDTLPIGEVSFFFDGGVHRVWLLLHARYRGKGYGVPALELLAETAFSYSEVSTLCAEPFADGVALQVFLRAGFHPAPTEEAPRRVLLPRPCR